MENKPRPQLHLLLLALSILLLSVLIIPFFAPTSYATSHEFTSPMRHHPSPTVTSTASETPVVTLPTPSDISTAPQPDISDTPVVTLPTPSDTPIVTLPTPSDTPTAPTTTTGQAQPYPQLYLPTTPAKATYYVSPSGSDSNDGSQNSPFATIQKAVQVVQPGSVVHVLPGVYTQPITVKTSGTADARISFVSDTRWAAQIKTTGSEVPWTTRADYIDIIGFDITSDGARDGMVNYGSYTRTMANHIHDIPGKCDNIGGSGVTDSNYTAHDNDLIGNVVNNIGSTYPTMCQYVHAIYHSNARGHVLNNIAFHNAGVGINLWHAATDTVVANNLVFGNKEHGISVGTDTGNNNGKKGDNFIVANNISIFNARLGIRERTGVGSHDQFLNNMVYGNGDAPFGDEGYNWPSSSGSKDVNTITADVHFLLYKVDGTGDYHLQLGSPAIDAGTNVGAPSYDYDGKPRPEGKGDDIGPFEFQVPTIPVLPN
jgi:hypothetical protein